MDCTTDIPNNLKKLQRHALTYLNSDLVVVQVSEALVLSAMDSIDRVYVICKNSILQSGKLIVEKLEQFSSTQREFRIDYGNLLSRVVDGRSLGMFPIFIGAYPPSYDSLWEDLKTTELEFPHDKTDFKQNSLLLAFHIGAIISSEEPATLLVITEDHACDILLDRAVAKSWKVEKWSWNPGKGKRFSCHSLLKHYISFCYVTSNKFANKGSNLIITSKDKCLEEWNNARILECFNALNMLPMWKWLNANTLLLHGKNTSDVYRLQTCIEQIHGEDSFEFMMQ